ncbi:hypothetical protein [Kitasatospora sp. NPDC088134]|uniref:hypothetical protein n=1 Tax=Kitasatospora sp. NPDC088134 TaxID=3364071 RepID=UPI00382E53C7
MRRFLRETFTEFSGHCRFTRAVADRIAIGDREAAAVFRTGTLAAALTRRGLDARGREIAAYVRLVLAADGAPDRLAWLHHP